MEDRMQVSQKAADDAALQVSELLPLFPLPGLNMFRGAIQRVYAETN